MAGFKAMTATSGPGISLMSEQISFAIAGEIPVVIVDVQRLGPSTGSATLGADGDMQFLRWGNSGGLPVIVLAPADVTDCYRLGALAFSLAERFRAPVFLASNKEVGMTRESIDLESVTLPAMEERRLSPAGASFLPFAVPAGEWVPDFLPMGGSVAVRQTSSTHGPDGFITGDPAQITQGLARLEEKIERAADTLALHECYGTPGASTLVIAYGVTARAARLAVERACAAGRPAVLMVLKALWPLPEAAIRTAAEGCRRVVVVEMNRGQLVREIRRVLPRLPVAFLGRMDGRLIAPGAIAEAMDHA